MNGLHPCTLPQQAPFAAVSRVSPLRAFFCPDSECVRDGIAKTNVAPTCAKNTKSQSSNAIAILRGGAAEWTRPAACGGARDMELVPTKEPASHLAIYSLYLQGCGQKEIARRLNRLGRKTPAQIMTERLGYDSQKPHKTRDGQFLWTYASVKNVLVEEAYTGVLVNHRREYLGGKARAVSETDWLRHENSYPVIIEKIIWQQVQTRLKQQARPAVNNRTKHRYAGLLSCQECGNVFSPMIRCWNGSRRVEYVCRGYHRIGKGYCSSHRIHEEILDKAVWDYTEKLREQYAAELKKVTQLQKQWALRKPVLDAHILSLQEKVQVLEQEIDEIVMEKIIHQT